MDITERIAVNIEPGHKIPAVTKDGPGWVETKSWMRASIPAPIDPECITDPGQIEPGDQVMVHAMGTWYPGTVLRVMGGAGKLEVEYTSGTNRTRRKAVDRRHLVPAGCGYPHRSALGEEWAAAVWAALAQHREAAKLAASNLALGYPTAGGAADLDAQEAADDRAMRAGALSRAESAAAAVRARRCSICGALCDHGSWDGINCPWCGGPKAVSDGIAALNAATVKAFDEGTLPTMPSPDDLVTVQAAEAGPPGEPIPPPAEAPRKVRRRVSISIRLPVTLELMVESDDEVGGGDGVAIEDATFSVIDVLRVIPPDVSTSTANEEIGNDPDASDDLDRAARSVEDEE